MWRTDSLEKTLILGKIEGRWRGDDGRWDGWMASPTQWTWVWASSRNWKWTGKPGVLQSMGSQSWPQLSDWTQAGSGSMCYGSLFTLGFYFRKMIHFYIYIHERLIAFQYFYWKEWQNTSTLEFSQLKTSKIITKCI